MSDFLKNTIIVVIAAIAAFTFDYILELIKRHIDNKNARERNTKSVLLTLRTTQRILESVKQKYSNNDFFDYIYLGQLENIAKKLDRFRFKESFMARGSDQSDFFELVSKLDLLIANMRSVQNYEYDQSLSAPNKEAYIKKTKATLITELVSLASKIESMINLLEE